MIGMKKVTKRKHFELGVKMNIDGGKGNIKRNTLFTTGMAVLDTIILQDAVIDALRGGTFVHKVFPRKRTADDAGKKAEIPVELGVENAAIGGFGTRGASGKGINGKTFARTAPFDATPARTRATLGHRVASRANGYTIFINAQGRGVLGVASVPIVEGDDSIHVPVIK